MTMRRRPLARRPGGRRARCCSRAPVGRRRASSPTRRRCSSARSEGERALAEGRYADAEKAYEALRRLSPGTAEVHARLGLIYFQQGKFADAVAPLREAIRLKPGLPKIDALLAMSLSELGRYEEALPALTQGVLAARRPRPASAWPDCTCSASTPGSDAIRTPSTSRSDCRVSIPTIPKCSITRAGCSRTSPTCRR